MSEGAERLLSLMVAHFPDEPGGWAEFCHHIVALRAELATTRAQRDEAQKDSERLDWMEQRVDGTGESMAFGGVCYWTLTVQRGMRGKLHKLGEGDDLRETIDEAMEVEASGALCEHCGNPLPEHPMRWDAPSLGTLTCAARPDGTTEGV